MGFVWIPVQQAVPTTDGVFMVTVRNKHGKYSVQLQAYHKDAKGCKWSTENVIAWCAKPTPYKEKGTTYV